MKNTARVVIIGGGSLGVSLLYHLAEEGWNDVILVEKGELTSGSTWHAAGLCSNFIGNMTVAKIHDYSISLYDEILPAQSGNLSLGEASRGKTPRRWEGVLRRSETKSRSDCGRSCLDL